MIADLSFKGCIANLIFFILLSRETAKSLFENVKKKYSKDKWDLKNVGQVVHYRTPKGPKKHWHGTYFCNGYTTSPHQCKSNIEGHLSDSDLSWNGNKSNIDDRYPSSCAEMPEEPEKERPISKKKKRTQSHSWLTRENGIATYKKVSTIDLLPK